MSEIKDSIRSMVQNLIKDDAASAELDLHPVFTAKMKEAAGVTAPVEKEVEVIDNDGNDE